VQCAIVYIHEFATIVNIITIVKKSAHESVLDNCQGLLIC